MLREVLFWSAMAKQINAIDFQKAREFSGLKLLAKQVVEGFITGLHKSPYHGFSVEFAEHRLYNKGESTRHIDWKLYARTEKLFVKRYEEETNLRCQLVLDASSSMYFPYQSDSELNKFQFSINAAACLIELLNKQRDAVGLTLFSDATVDQIAAKSSLAHLNLLYHKLESAFTKQPLNATTNLVEQLHQIAETVHKRSLIIVFSDMFDSEQVNNEHLFEALQHLKHRKHEVIVFHTYSSKLEQAFEFDNRPHAFVDLETGEELILNPSSVQEYYQNNFNQFVKSIQLKCTQYKIDFVPCAIENGYAEVLLSYLIKRSKML